MKATFAVILTLLCFASAAVAGGFVATPGSYLALDDDGSYVIGMPPKGMLGIATPSDYKYQFEVEWKDGYTYVWELEVYYGDVDTKPTFKWVFKRMEVTEE